MPRTKLNNAGKELSNLQRLDQAMFDNLGKHLSIKQNQKLIRLLVERLCSLVGRFDFTPKKPMGWMTQFIASLDSALLPDDDQILDLTKTGQRRGEIRQPKDDDPTRLGEILKQG